jgi:hypothetical protein
VQSANHIYGRLFATVHSCNAFKMMNKLTTDQIKLYFSSKKPNQILIQCDPYANMGFEYTLLQCQNFPLTSSHTFDAIVAQ